MTNQKNAYLLRGQKILDVTGGEVNSSMLGIGGGTVFGSVKGLRHGQQSVIIELETYRGHMVPKW